MLLNSSIRYNCRLYAPLGVDLWVVKLRAPLPKILAEASTYAAGKVRVDCIMGVRKLAQLRWVWGGGTTVLYIMCMMSKLGYMHDVK